MRFIYLLLALLCVGAQRAYSQSLVAEPIANQGIDPALMPIKDPSQPGKYCAELKVGLSVEGATFEGAILGDPVYSDGRYCLTVNHGMQEIVINVPGFEAAKFVFEDYGVNSLEGKNVYHFDVKLIYPTRKLHIAVTPVDAILKIGGEQVALDEEGKALTELTVGTYSYNITAEGYVAKDSTIELTKSEEPMELEVALAHVPVEVSPIVDVVDNIERPRLEPQKPQQKPEFYVGANYQLGGLSGVGLSVGGYIAGVNIQADVIVGMSKSEPIYWNGLSTDPYSYTYSPLYFGLKLGYGIGIGDKLRLTPQVGVGVSKISGSVDHQGQGTDPGVTAMSVVPLSVGIRAEYMITNNIGVAVAPEFDIALQQGAPYETVSAVSSDVKGFGQGFNLKAGVFFKF